MYVIADLQQLNSSAIKPQQLKEPPCQPPPARKPPTITKSKTCPWPNGGRKEITLAEIEMPGLMSTRAEYKGPTAIKGRAHRGLPAYDDPNGGAD